MINYTYFNFLIVKPNNALISYWFLGFYSYFYVHNKISKIYIVINWNIIKELFIWIS